MSKIRAFLCFELDDAVKSALALFQKQLRALGSGVSWSRIDGIHLTIKFLGDIEEQSVDDIETKISAVARSHSAFTLRLTHAGAFPNLNRPRVYWVGVVDEPSGRLLSLQKEADAALTQLGFEAEQRPFSPHLTLGRVKNPGYVADISRMVGSYEAPSLEFAATEIVLMKSDLKPTGAVYTPLFKIALLS
ncbi:MAG: RNA 2',3'-cyclic phosphodiesterase [Calditrichaeota bacterium]|nr:MAG: RNA 2',3'-cyclic phosphodiesterase [Calditrichota bacterium]